MIRSLRWLPLTGWACAASPAPPPPVDRVGWIVGEWVHEEDDTRMIERWTAATDGSLLGSGYVRVGPQLLGYAETLAIHPGPEGDLQLTAWPMAQPPSRFTVTLEGNRSLVASREADAFPTTIRYAITDDEGDTVTMDVRASGPASQDGPERTEHIRLRRLDP